MENQEILDSGLTHREELELNSAARDYLLQTTKWAKFLAIVGLIFSAFIILMGLTAGTLFGSLFALAGQTSGMQNNFTGSMGIMFTVIYGIMGLIMMYPCIRLLQFSNKGKLALDTNDSLAIEDSFRRLRSVFRFYGILTIIYLSFIALGLLMALVGLGFR